MSLTLYYAVIMGLLFTTPYPRLGYVQQPEDLRTVFDQHFTKDEPAVVKICPGVSRDYMGGFQGHHQVWTTRLNVKRYYVLSIALSCPLFEFRPKSPSRKSSYPRISSALAKDSALRSAISSPSFRRTNLGWQSDQNLIQFLN